MILCACFVTVYFFPNLFLYTTVKSLKKLNVGTLFWGVYYPKILLIPYLY